MCKIHVTNHFFTRSPSTHYSWFPSQQISILSQFEVNVKLITCYLGGHMLPRTVKLNFILWSGRTTGQKMDVAGEGGGVRKKCALMRERPWTDKRSHQRCGSLNSYFCSFNHTPLTGYSKDVNMNIILFRMGH